MTDRSGQIPKVRNVTLKETTTTTTIQVDVSWSPVTGVTHYEIVRWDADADTPSWADAGRFAPAAVTPSGGSCCKTTNALATSDYDNTFYYAVRGIHAGPSRRK